MYDKGPNTGFVERSDKVTNKTIIFHLVNADTVFDRHINIDSVLHRLAAIGHQLRLSHQTGSKRTALYTFTGATAIEIDFIIAPILSNLGTYSQVLRIAAA